MKTLKTAGAAALVFVMAISMSAIGADYKSVAAENGKANFQDTTKKDTTKKDTSFAAYRR